MNAYELLDKMKNIKSKEVKPEVKEEEDDDDIIIGEMKAVDVLRLVEDVSEGGFNINIAKVPLSKARQYSATVFKEAGKNLDKELPDFDRNYIGLQKACKQAIDVPRIEMPVIEPQNLSIFQSHLSAGQVDIFKPYAKGYLYTPIGLEHNKTEAEEWIKLGLKDKNLQDDKIKALLTRKSAYRLFPSQSEIWLEKIIYNIIKHGKPTSNSSVTEATIISSADGYILDGHHRYGQVMIANPSLGMKTLVVPIDIETLIKVGRSYGNALGNKQKG